jgi:hypothetical protein
MSHGASIDVSSPQSFGESIRRHRVLQGHWDREEFAKGVGVPVENVRRIEMGELHGVPVQQVVKIMGTFKLNPDGRQHLAGVAAKVLAEAGNHVGMVNRAIETCWQ